MSKYPEFKIAINKPYDNPNNKLKWISITDFNQALTDLSNASQTSIPPLFEDMNSENPLIAPAQILGAMASGLSSLIPVIGSAVSTALSAIFSTMNTNFSDEENLNKLLTQVSLLIDNKIDAHTLKEIGLKIEGVSRVQASLTEVLDSFINKKHNKSQLTRDQLKDQLYNRFDDFISAYLLEAPQILHLSEKGGVPFFCQLSAIYILTVTSFLANKENIEMEDAFYEKNLKELEKYSLESYNTISKTINKNINELNRFKDINTLIRDYYVSGLSSFSAAMNKVFSAKYLKNFITYNSMEIYGDNYYVHNGLKDKPYKEMYKDYFNGAPRFNNNMLQKVNYYYHIDAILRSKNTYPQWPYQPFDQDYELSLEYEGCRGTTGDVHDKFVNAEFYKINRSNYTNEISDVHMPARYLSDAPYGSWTYAVMEADNATYTLGRGNVSGKTSLNLPGYFLNGVLLYNSRPASGECRVDSGKWLSESGPIFRHYDGFATQTIKVVDNVIDKNIVYHADLNHHMKQKDSYNAFLTGGSIEPMLGKNIIKLDSNKEVSFQFFLEEPHIDNRIMTIDMKMLVTANKGINQLYLTALQTSDYDDSKSSKLLYSKKSPTMKVIRSLPNGIVNGEMDVYELSFSMANPFIYKTASLIFKLQGITWFSHLDVMFV